MPSRIVQIVASGLACLFAGCRADAPPPSTVPAHAPAPITTETYAGLQGQFGRSRLDVRSDGTLVEKTGPFEYRGSWRRIDDAIIEGTFIEPKLEKVGDAYRSIGTRPVARYYQLDRTAHQYLWDYALASLRRRQAAPQPTTRGE